jgi:5,5'-dehydrodivanillate O-demethylase
MITAYPVEVLGGLFWAYMGPDPAPLLPRHELFVKEGVDRSIEMTPLPCNWLNAMDNSLDPVHYEHLHGHYGNYVAKKKGKNPPMFTARHIKIDFDVFRFGIYKRRLMEGQPETIDDWQIGHPILFPNTLLVGDANVARYQIRVPIDDTHTMHYNYNTFTRKPGDGPKWEGIPLQRTTIYEEDSSIVADTVFKQDALGWVGQGPVSDRTVEHLVTSDRGVILYHNMLIEQAEKVARGEEPMGLVHDVDENEPMINIKFEAKAKEAYWPDGRPVQYFKPIPDARLATK